MPAQHTALRGAHDLLLVVGCAALVIGLIAVGHGVLAIDQRAGWIPDSAVASPSAHATSEGIPEPPAACDCDNPDSGAIADATSSEGRRQPLLDPGQLNGGPVERGARRTYLLGSAAVAHRRILARSHPATPVAVELAAVAVSSGAP